MLLKNHFCSLCNQGFETLRGLNIHIRGHNNASTSLNPSSDTLPTAASSSSSAAASSSPPKFLCRHCTKKFPSRHLYYRHIREEHVDKQFLTRVPVTTKCRICELEFLNDKDLSDHMKEHTEELERKYCCPLCGKKFCSKLDLRYHRKEKHARQYTCPQCPKQLMDKKQLLRHIQKNHKNEFLKKTKCPVCKEKFYSREKAKEHFDQFHTFKKKLIQVQEQKSQSSADIDHAFTSSPEPSFDLSPKRSIKNTSSDNHFELNTASGSSSKRQRIQSTDSWSSSLNGAQSQPPTMDAGWGLKVIPFSSMPAESISSSASLGFPDAEECLSDFESGSQRLSSSDRDHLSMSTNADSAIGDCQSLSTSSDRSPKKPTRVSLPSIKIKLSKLTGKLARSIHQFKVTMSEVTSGACQTSAKLQEAQQRYDNVMEVWDQVDKFVDDCSNISPEVDDHIQIVVDRLTPKIESVSSDFLEATLPQTYPQLTDEMIAELRAIDARQYEEEVNEDSKQNDRELKKALSLKPKTEEEVNHEEDKKENDQELKRALSLNKIEPKVEPMDLSSSQKGNETLVKIEK